MTPKMTKTIVWSVIGIGALVASYFAYQHFTKVEVKETEKKAEATGGCPTPTYVPLDVVSIGACTSLAWDSAECMWRCMGGLQVGAWIDRKGNSIYKPNDSLINKQTKNANILTK